MSHNFYERYAGSPWCTRVTPAGSCSGPGIRPRRRRNSRRFTASPRTGRALRWCLSAICVFFPLILAAAFPAAPEDYGKKTPIGGPLEAKYLAPGKYRVGAFREKTEAPVERVTVFFPDELRGGSRRWPAVIMVNGTGILPDNYQAVFRHLASWGFIVIGNDDPGTWSGESADRTLEWLLRQNANPDSIFFNRVDTGNIGISGHSQGGVGMFNAVTLQPHSGLYKTAAALSPLNESGAARLRIPYDIAKVRIPTLMIAGTDGYEETRLVIPPERLREMYRRLSAPKVMARRTGCSHSETLYAADGYVTAWFMWMLKGDSEAAKVFTGPDPELKSNPLYRNRHIRIPADFTP